MKPIEYNKTFSEHYSYFFEHIEGEIEDRQSKYPFNKNVIVTFIGGLQGNQIEVTIEDYKTLSFNTKYSQFDKAFGWKEDGYIIIGEQKEYPEEDFSITYLESGIKIEGRTGFNTLIPEQQFVYVATYKEESLHDLLV